MQKVALITLTTVTTTTITNTINKCILDEVGPLETLSVAGGNAIIVNGISNNATVSTGVYKVQSHFKSKSVGDNNPNNQFNERGNECEG